MTKINVRELLRAYSDLEKFLHVLKQRYSANADTSLRQIDVKKLIQQVTRSKRRIERKIGNTLLLEKNALQRKLRRAVRSTASSASSRVRAFGRKTSTPPTRSLQT